MTSSSVAATPLNAWIAGARPRTLPATVVPVVVGTALAYREGSFIWWRALLCLVVGLAMQIGVNYANDYSDGVRGTDASRVGPRRLVGSGLAAPSAVKRAAFVSFGIGALAGVVLCLAVNPWLMLVGVIAIAAAWFYTGGSRPYGYRGWGEFSVFIFFGLVATVGTAYLQSEEVTAVMVAVACALGFLSVALLVVNNLRDIPSDAAADKRTLAVRLGDKNTRFLYVALLASALVIALLLTPFEPHLVLVLVSVPLLVRAARPVMRGAAAHDLIPVLGATGRLQLVFGAAMVIALVL